MRTDRPALRIVACFLIYAVPLTAPADTASPKLARYKKQVDDAVDRALAWMAKVQSKEGYFPGGHGQTNAAVALGGMAFLSKGYTPNSRPYGQVLNKCIDYVLKHQRANGTLDAAYGGGGMYSHCISTLLLSEVSGMVDPLRQKRLDRALPKALNLILAAQRINKPQLLKGGWRYRPNSRDSDISVSGWALMALRSARLNGAPVPKKAIGDAAQFILNCRRPDGGFGYMPGGGSGIARTGVALLCLELTGHHGKETTTKASDYILARTKSDRFIRDGHFFYAVYYCSQAMFQVGGERWEKFAEGMYDHMLKRQHKDGYWRAGNRGPGYATAMSVLALTVVYRQLPIYQR